MLIKNRPPGSQYEFPASEIVDAGFLELVRYGIRKAGDPLNRRFVESGGCRLFGTIFRKARA